jgi:26S proteasome regulatory subunit T3
LLADLGGSTDALRYIKLQEEYIKDEQRSAESLRRRCGLTVSRNLKRELVRAQEEIKRIQSVPLVIGQFMEAIDQKSAARSLPKQH